MNNFETRAGYIAIVGRPNVGKSTLLNKLLNQKISIVSRKPHTTRNKILGVKTIKNTQFIYIDTPGIHFTKTNMLGKQMDRTISEALQYADIVVFVIAGTRWTKEDKKVALSLQQLTCPIILAINKVDLVHQKTSLLKHIDSIKNELAFQEIIPISAKNNNNLDSLEEKISKKLPNNPFFFDQQQITTYDQSFFSAEIIREKLLYFLGQELPYTMCVIIDCFNQQKNIIKIMGTIYVERQGQKIIIIGNNGDLLKKISTLARKELEQRFKSKIFLKLWVKVKPNWTNDKILLNRFGYK